MINLGIQQGFANLIWKTYTALFLFLVFVRHKTVFIAVCAKEWSLCVVKT